MTEPAFPYALRGYARPDVDAHLSRADQELAQLRERLAEAERDRDLQRERAELAEQALTAGQADAAERVRRAEQAIAHAQQAASPGKDPRKETQPIPLGTRLATKTTTVAVLKPSGPQPAAATPAPVVEREPEPELPRDEPVRSRVPLLVGAGLALAGLAAAVLFALGRDDEPAATTAAPEPAASSLTGSTAPQAAQVAPGALPEGWTSFRDPEGRFSIGLPPGWKSVGSGDEREFVSESGLTNMWVRSGGTDVSTFKEEFAADKPSYQQISSGEQDFRGGPALTWDYTFGAGDTAQRGSDLAVQAGGEAYWLHVQSRASAWEFAEPLVEGFRASFTPGAQSS